MNGLNPGSRAELSKRFPGYVPLNRTFQEFQSGLICGTLINLDGCRGTVTFDHNGSFLDSRLERENGSTACKKTPTTGLNGGTRQLGVFSEDSGI
jgi:hypothetical protein